MKYSNKKIVYKAYYNFEKEEAWLNMMSAKGYNLISYTAIKYIFEKTNDTDYIYRIEYLDEGKSKDNLENYLEFLEESGIEFVSRYNNWIYLRCKANCGRFDLFTDLDSKIKHYKSILKTYTTLMLCLLPIFISSMVSLNNNANISFLKFIYLLPIITIIIILFSVVLPTNRVLNNLNEEKKLRE